MTSDSHTDHSTPPLLAYAAPKAFFDGAYRYRSGNGLLTVAVTTGVGAALLFARQRMLSAMGFEPVWWCIGQGIGLLGAAMLVGAALTVVFLLQGRERPVRVTEHGITHGRKHWPWVRIARFGGMKYTNGIAITFQLRGRGHSTRILITTPLMTAEQFAALAQAVTSFARETNTALLVVKKPEVPSSD
jgi:hypothetical protein